MKGIPLFITKKMKVDLKSKGFDDQLIGLMKPEDAHLILENKLSKNDFIFKTVKTLLNEIVEVEAKKDLFKNVSMN